MLAQLLDLALGHRIIVILAVLVTAAAGAWSYTQLKLEAYPDISDPGVVVITLYPGFAPRRSKSRSQCPSSVR